MEGQKGLGSQQTVALQEFASAVRHRLAQAHETLAEAEQLLTSEAFRGAVNRLYYAAFYGARALPAEG